MQNQGKGRIKHGVLALAIIFGMFLLLDSASLLIDVSASRVDSTLLRTYGVLLSGAMIPGMLIGLGVTNYLTNKLDPSLTFHITSWRLYMSLGLIFLVWWLGPWVWFQGCVALMPESDREPNMLVRCYLMGEQLGKIGYGLLFGAVTWIYVWIYRTEKRKKLYMTLAVRRHA